ncbi:hypothetical protein PSTG_17610 [Puccinia striiformis f. sp. tritici PST-78]|uniref:Peptidase A2 domain-containing protein n=1 Tax=Puccinia striiformis f. sp. tritici PST-78 TaxID=1165861 RepID=A0A0L0UPK1_9BASI|nr:hypothetical protein PSTG_17610 [Puccinia striiformis f. sp. tritici PST-78]
MTIDKFILRYEAVGRIDKATARDLAEQVTQFIKDLDVQEEVEEMSGYLEGNWELLKAQLLSRFGSPLPLVKYTRQDLKQLIHSATSTGGIKTLEAFKVFKTKFESITHYLVRMGYSSHLEESRELLLEALHKDMESLVTKELIRDNQMLVSRDGGDILPNTETILEYIYKELQSASVMERRQMGRGELISHKPMLKPCEPIPIQKPPATNPSNLQLANQMEDLVRKFESFSTGRVAPPHQPYGPPPQRYTTAPPQNYPGSSSQNQPNPNRPSYYKCFYCFQMDHSAYNCQHYSTDEQKGLVRKQGRDYYLSDNTLITWDPRRPVKAVVDKFSTQPPQETVTTSFGQIEEPDFPQLQTYEADLGKRTRSGKEYEEGPSSGKRGKKEQGSVMDVDEEILKIVNTPLSDDDEETPHRNPSPPTGSVRFKLPRESAKNPKEKSRKTQLEKPLDKTYPGIGQETAEKILKEGTITLKVGEVFAMSPEVTQEFKKLITAKRIPIEPPTNSTEASTNAVDLDESDEEDNQSAPLLYSCPLGFIKLTINGHHQQALLDTGSMVNIIPEELAQKFGLLITERIMKLKGIGGHKTEIIGVAERVPVYVGSILRHVHFCVAEGPVKKGDSVSIRDSKGQNYLIPIAYLKHHKNERTLPANIVTRDFLDQTQDFKLNQYKKKEFWETLCPLFLLLKN